MAPPTMRTAAREDDSDAGAADAAAARRDRRIALLRFGLANAQMVAAIVAVILVIRFGMSWPTAVAVLVSFTLAAISRSLRRRPPPPAAAHSLRSITPK